MRIEYEFSCRMRPNLSKSAMWNYKILKQIYARKLAIENDVDISLDLEWHFVGQLVESYFCLRARYPIISIPISPFQSISYPNIYPDKIFEYVNKHFVSNDYNICNKRRITSFFFLFNRFFSMRGKSFFRVKHQPFRDIKDSRNNTSIYCMITITFWLIVLIIHVWNNIASIMTR